MKMDRFVAHARPSTLRRAIAVVGLAFSLVLALIAMPEQASAAGINIPIAMGQRFVGSASPPKSIPIPLSTEVGPIRSLAVAGINATTFQPIKQLGITIFSGSEVKQIVLDTIAGLADNVKIGFKVNALNHSDPTDFTLGGNCVGADGTTTSLCVATVTFKPASPGLKSDAISPDVSITQGLSQIEDSLQNALSNQGVKGEIISFVFPLFRSLADDELTNGIRDAMLNPVATATGTGVAGPFTDPTTFIKRQYADFAAGTPSAADISSWTKKFEANTLHATLIDTLRKASPWDGRVGPVSRLYSAYFLRPPDTSGLKFWVGRSRGGMRLYAISSNFAGSSEFTRRYGALTKEQFVQLVYQNVLGRAPDASGLAYWVRQLNNGSTRGRLMVGFSESSEYIRKQAPTTTIVETWFGMLHRGASAAEMTGYTTRLKSGTPITTIMSELLASTEYRTLVLG
jgi:hypothetical protein